MIKPNPRWLTKQYLTLGTISLLLAVVGGIVHLILALTLSGDDASTGILVTWLVTGGVVLLMWLIALPIVILWFKNLEYVLEEDKVIIRKGILTKIQQNIPMNMVTDFRLQRTLYDRPLGIGSILVQTAGQSTTATGYEGKLAGLENWDELHEDLRRRIRSERGMRAPGYDRTEEMGAVLEEIRSIRQLLEARR